MKTESTRAFVAIWPTLLWVGSFACAEAATPARYDVGTQQDSSAQQDAPGFDVGSATDTSTQHTDARPMALAGTLEQREHLS